MQRISEGAYRVGTTLPKELELAEELGVSRSTIRAALRSLQDAGMISRKRNAGTRVEAARPTNGPESFHQTLATIEDVAQYGVETKRVVRDIVEEAVDPELALRLGCSPGRTWVRVTSLRVSRTKSALPICWTDVYIDAEIGRAVKSRVRRYQGLIASLVEEDCGRRTAEIRQSIRATRVSALVAQAINVEAGMPVLEIERRYLDSKAKVYLMSRSYHPADRFHYESRLLRQNSSVG
ncbi:DNA-binding GntR family transcriptional regulator [Bradyrhizobium sp. CIR48]|nr:DNA-binding GntR family transcriptional regulator [Bradyrhizobium sp. CIR48]